MAGVTRIPPRLRSTLRIGAALVIVVATVAVVGVGPFLHGLASISPTTILVAVALAAVATAAASWRWHVVSTGFGLPLAWGEAFASYYRSQFLNTVLPGGVMGDVHRAYAHGRLHARVGLAARAVAAERVAGQLVQIGLTLAVLLPLGLTSPLAPLAGISAAIALLAAAAVAAIALTRRGRAALQREYGMLRPLLSRPLRLLAIAAASVVVVAAHAATFVVAGLASGVRAGAAELIVVALIVLGAAAIPVNVGGWGPREAVAASAFALVGLGAGAGLAVSTAFGVLTMVAVAPGAATLLVSRFRSLHLKGIIGRRRSA
jgi:uncharacterized membrane protein YbhN (UPF0104 family)